MLTTIENIKNIRDIATNLRDGRIAPYIKEVEDAYILPTIGAALYKKLDEGSEQDDILLNGGYYNGADAQLNYCHGIRLAVAYFAYARLLKNNQINVTAFGVVGKTGNFSQPTDTENIDDAVAQARKMGDLYLDSVKNYINRNQCGCSAKASGHKIQIQVLS